MSEKKAIICIHYAFYVVSVFLHLIQRNNRASNLSFICKGGILMSTSAENRGQFGSKLGFILSAAGSAVGLGNIWKFPGKAYFCGGGAFLIIYLIIVALVGTTVMMAEFTVGRKTHKNAVGAMRELNAKWSWVGGLGVLTGFIILCYYCQVGGWAMKYIVAYIVDVKTIWADPTAYFLNNLLGADGTFPLQGAVIFPFIFLFLTAYIISHGTAGIEKMSKLLMPLLFIILIALSIHSLLMPGGEEGLRFLFRPDFSKVTPSTVLVALGQAFFSLSIGIGTMVTYASYFKPDTNLRHTALNVTILDTLVAILAGVVIFPAVFSVGIEPSSGPSLVFITLPGIFNSMPLSMVWSSVFFLLLVVAALTSTISLHEVITAYLHEEWHMSRRAAAWSTTGACMALAAVASLSLGVLKGWNIFGLTIFDSLDYLTANILLPAGGFFTCIFVGWRLDRKILKAEISNNGTLKFRIYGVFIFLVRYVCPAVLLLIFLDNLGLF